jgi:hypothetical protein
MAVIDSAKINDVKILLVVQRLEEINLVCGYFDCSACAYVRECPGHGVYFNFVCGCTL